MKDPGRGFYLVQPDRNFIDADDAKRYKDILERAITEVENSDCARLIMADKGLTIQWVGPEPRAYAAAQWIRAVLACRITLDGDGPRMIEVLHNLADYLEGRTEVVPALKGERWSV